MRAGNPYLRPGEHYDPYAKAWRKNLTEAEVKNLWPYAKVVTPDASEKESPQVEPLHDWLEETLSQAGLDKTQKDTLTSAPSRDAVQLDLFEAGAVVNNLFEMTDSLVTSDMVVLPKHYARFEIEPIRFICENNLNFFQGNIIKYVLRHDAKNGLEDLRKARRYLDMFIKFVEGDKDWWRKSGGK